jgi:hypothetical protein
MSTFHPTGTPQQSVEMFDLKDLPPAIVEHWQLLLVGLTVSWLVLGYFKGERRKVQNLFLTHR